MLTSKKYEEEHERTLQSNGGGDVVAKLLCNESVSLGYREAP